MCTGKDPLLKRYEIPVVWGGDNVALTLISRLVVVHVVWVSFLHRMQDRETEEDRITWQLSKKQHIRTRKHIRTRLHICAVCSVRHKAHFRTTTYSFH